jgi:hypothetical protein
MSRDASRKELFMKETATPRSHLKAIPMLANESLYVGIDIGKRKHVAGFLSKTLLARHTRFEACPALVVVNSREGFRALVERLREYAPLEQVFVLYVRYNHGADWPLSSSPGAIPSRA